MARPKGTPKTGGRKAGTPNRATMSIRDKLAEIGCDPALALAEMAMNPETDRALRAKILADLLPYIAPRLGRITVDIEEPMPPPPNLIIGFLAPSHPSTLEG